jgi:hypothetical protein
MQTWQSYISIAKDILTGVAALTAALVAVLGLQAWKRQLKGKVEYELARRVLRSAFNVRDAIRFVRNPLQMGGEIERAIKEAGVDIDPKSAAFRAKSEAAVYQGRLKKVDQALSELGIELTEAEVSWGPEIKNRVRPLRDSVAKLVSKIWLRIDNLENPEDKGDAKERKEIRDIIYLQSEDPDRDTFAAEINRAVDEIAEFLKPYLKI